MEDANFRHSTSQERDIRIGCQASCNVGLSREISYPRTNTATAVVYHYCSVSHLEYLQLNQMLYFASFDKTEVPRS
jgi:hypothetical protein